MLSLAPHTAYVHAILSSERIKTHNVYFRFIDYIMHNRGLKACSVRNKLWEKGKGRGALSLSMIKCEQSALLCGVFSSRFNYEIYELSFNAVPAATSVRICMGIINKEGERALHKGIVFT
jgi:hypothetical protein